MNDQHDAPWDDGSGEFPLINGSDLLGPYGVTSAELAAIDPEQIDRWERERQRAARERAERMERARTNLLDKLDEMLRAGGLRDRGYDLLWIEIDMGYLPDVYRGATGRWLVYSDHERRSWSLEGWNQHAVEVLVPPIPVEARETARLYLTPPPVLPNYHPVPRMTPLVGLPEATDGARRPWHPRLNSSVPRRTPQVWMNDMEREQ